MPIEPGRMGRLDPGIATKWDRSDGGKTLTLTLRSGREVRRRFGVLGGRRAVHARPRAGLKDGPWASLLESIDRVDIV